MHPLEITDIQQDLLSRGPILLLDTTAIAIRFVIQLVLDDKFPMLLPMELWLNIIDQYYKSTVRKFVAVRATSISITPSSKMIHCRDMLLDVSSSLNNATAIIDAEDSLNHLRNHDENSQDHNLILAEGPDEIHAIDFPSQGPTSTSTTTAALSAPDYLFTAITVPDIIARLEDGRCWVCRGRRWICPGCTGGVAQKFDAHMGCGVNLACPLCMGLDFMQEDKLFLQKYDWDAPPVEEEEAREAGISARLAELGYA
ncbi:MAG: hypothetical protein Q9204_006107 [Flavoplaca sp. TL-2023a]